MDLLTPDKVVFLTSQAELLSGERAEYSDSLIHDCQNQLIHQTFELIEQQMRLLQLEALKIVDTFYFEKEFNKDDRGPMILRVKPRDLISGTTFSVEWAVWKDGFGSHIKKGSQDRYPLMTVRKAKEWEKECFKILEPQLEIIRKRVKALNRSREFLHTLKKLIEDQKNVQISD